MASWTDREDRIDRATRRSSLAEPVTYTPAGGSAVVIRGVFSPTSIDVDPGSGVAIVSVQPVLGVRVADLPQEPQQGDTLTARGVDYRVVKPTPVGAGWMDLQLHRV